MENLVVETFRKFLAGTVKTSPCWTTLRSLPVEGWIEEPATTGESLQIMLLKAVKKSPESLSGAASSIVSNLPVRAPCDGLVAGGIMPLVVRMLKSSDIAVRNAGILLSKHICRRLNDAEQVKSALCALLDGLRGKSAASNSITALQGEHKTSILVCLQACIAAVSSAGCSPSSASLAAAEGLQGFVLKEEDQGVCMLAGRVMGLWIGALHSAGDVSADGYVIDALKSAAQSAKANPRVFWICAISNAWRMGSEVSAAFSIACTDFLLVLLHEASSKVQVDREAMAALGALAALMDAKTLLQLMAGSKALHTLLCNSFTNISSQHAIISSADAVAALRALRAEGVYEGMTAHLSAGLWWHEQLVATLRLVVKVGFVWKVNLLFDSNAGALLDGVTAAGLAFGRTLLFSYSVDLHSYANHLLVDIVRECGAAVTSVLWSLMKVLSMSCKEPHSHSQIRGRFPEEVCSTAGLSAESAFTPSAFSSCMLLLIARKDCDEDRWLEFVAGTPYLALTALYCCHAAVSPSVKAAHCLWDRFFKNSISLDGIDAFAVNAVAVQTAECIFRNGTLSSNPWMRRGSHRAVGLLCDKLSVPMRLFGSNLMTQYACLVQVHLREVDASDWDHACMHAAFDLATAVDVAVATKMTNVVVTDSNEVTNADRKKTVPRSARKGNFGADQEFEADWAERVRKEKEQLAQQSMSSVEVLLRAEVQEEIACRRAKGEGAIARTYCLAEAIGALTFVRRALAQTALGIILSNSNIWKLLSFDLVSEFLQDALLHIARHVIEEELQGNAREMVACLRMICCHQGKQLVSDSAEFSEVVEDPLQDAIDLPAPFLRLFRALNTFSSTRNDGLSVSSFLFIYPVLSGVCLLKTGLNHIELSFSLIKSLWPSKLTSSVIVADLFNLCLSLQGTYPRAHLSADQLLHRVALQAVPLSVEVLQPLLGSRGLLHIDAKIRGMCTELISNVNAVGGLDVDESSGLDCAMWMAKFDDAASVREHATSFCARRVWSSNDSRNIPLLLLSTLQGQDEYARSLAARSLAGFLDLRTGTVEFDVLLAKLIDDFKACQVVSLPASHDARSRKKGPVDATLVYRCSLAATFQAIVAQDFLKNTTADLNPITMQLLLFLVNHGVVDAAQEVRAAMLAAAVALVAGCGSGHAVALLSVFEEILARKSIGCENMTEFDHRYSATVVLLGTVGRHLGKQHAELARILALLMDSLKIPSESVQRAVSDCLIPIAQSLKGTATVDALMNQLIEKVLQSSTYGERRGAAFGLSALVKGLGIPSLKSYNLVTTLKEACTTGSISNRQGALFAVECLADRLGLLFEPYVMGIMDVLLDNFSHSSDHVRDAAQVAVRVIMTKLSAHGVKQILTPVMTALNNESAWKTRQEAIRMLGAMANCAPKQLSACLPQIVPCLVQAGSDPHPKVRDSAKTSMAEISAVIRNPEVSQLSPLLLLAIGDPANKTKEALDALLQCEFMHTIDAPSLALLVPILARALKDRSGDLKRKAAAITGNMMGMVSESGVLAPYMVSLLPGLKDCLVDPIPDVRASGAKALGSLYDGIGDTGADIQDLLRWLIATLKSVASPVERSGAAQGLAEICGSMDDARLHSLIQLVLNLEQMSTNAGREGTMWFLSFLPYSLKERFATYIDGAMPVILQGLSDDTDNVREVALRAGKVVISVLGMNHAVHLAPALLDGISLDDWRIRLNSLQLLGDLLYLIGDAKVSSSLDSSEGAEDGGNGLGASAVLANIRAHLGLGLTDTVLATLYVARADIAIAVRQHALQIWKVVVTNTPRTLVEVMPALVKILVAKLASHAEDLRAIAGRSIGELVSKLGERVVAVIIPPLEQGLSSGDSGTRLGVCVGLGEVLTACSRKQAEDYLPQLIDAVKKALCDTELEVREQAAKVFMILYKCVGSAAIDQIVPALLNSFGDHTKAGSLALLGLRQIVSQRPRDMLEYLLPVFLVEPIACSAAKALASVAEVSGQYIHHHFHDLLPTLVQEMCRCEDKAEGDRLAALQSAVTAVVGSISDAGTLPFISEIGKQLDADASAKKRRWGCWVVGQFFLTCKADYRDYLPVLLKYLLLRVTDTELTVLTALRDCLTGMVAAVPLDDIAAHVDFIRNCITSAASAARHKTGAAVLLSDSGEFLLPLFMVPKSLDPFFAIFSHGLLNGRPQVKELSAEMIAECAAMADNAVLKPTLLKVVGSLIRIIGDRYPSQVKSAILQALIVLMRKGGASLKAFVPQLQTTFVKALNDPMREVRQRGGKALGQLLELGPRVDPLLTDLSQLCLQVESHAIRLSVLEALETVLRASGAKAAPATMMKIVQTAQAVALDEEDWVRLAAAQCMGLACAHFQEAQLTDVLLDLIGGNAFKSEDEGVEWVRDAAKLVCLGAVMQVAGNKGDEVRQEVFELFLRSGVNEERISVLVALASALVLLLSSPTFEGSADRKAEYKTCAQSSLHVFAKTIARLCQHPGSSEVRVHALLAVREVCKNVYLAASQQFNVLFPAVVGASKDIDLRVKYAADRAMLCLIEGKATTMGTGSTAFQQFVARNDDAELCRAIKECQRRLVAASASTSAGGEDSSPSVLAVFGAS